MNQKFRIAFCVGLAIVGVVFIGSCNQPHLPWNKSTWPPRGERLLERQDSTPSSVTNESQEPLEDFCEDMKESIDQYRSYMEDETISERRRRNIRNLVDQYDRECIEKQQ